jgi:D-glycero-alpha-D-manno-heptose-7-phosphate kinase
MIVVRTPLRVSFFGGGTDFSKWYNQNGGGVLSCAIKKYTYVQIKIMQNFFNHKYRIRYYINEEKNLISDIEHPVVREALKKYCSAINSNNGLEILHTADLPARSGLGSSSSFSISMINAIHQLKKKKLSKKKLWELAINLEQNILKESVGSQDQVICSKGGFNFISFNKEKIIVNDLYSINKEKINYLKNYLTIFFTGFTRDANKIEKEKIKKISRNYDYYKSIHQIALSGKDLITSKNKNFFIDEFSYLLNEQWKLKKKLSEKVSNKKIDDIYEFALKNGAMAGKLLGAGQGGFFLLLSRNLNDKKKLIKSLKKLNHFELNYDFEGSKKIYDN